MAIWTFFWDDENDPDGNVEHIAEHDLTIDDAEHVLNNPTDEGTSKATGLPAAWGYTPDGRYIIVVYEKIGEDTVRVTTAYEVPERRRKRRR
ncbi:MAG TPA: DUF4258 domain-containing protein [Gemmataceae bacterium]|jgi:uncharacterized DUF497 family protein|nr:DUF4258 domain-containing protein [Gemmataceae bacterium]